MKIWSFKLAILAISLLIGTTSNAQLSSHCTWPTSPDTFSERSTGYVVTSTDWNRAQCALNNLQSQLGTNLANIFKLSANNTISGNSTFTGDVTFSDFASCTLGVDSSGKLICAGGGGLTCNTIMGCEAKDTDAKFLSVTGGPCNPSTGTCVFELSANWADINMTGIRDNGCRIAVSNQGRLETRCKNQDVKRYQWTTESGSGGQSCPIGLTPVGSACLPRSEVLVNGISRDRVNIIESISISPDYDTITKELELLIKQGGVAPIHLWSLNNTLGETDMCVKLGTEPLVEFNFQSCFIPAETKTECLTMLASGIVCKSTGGCTDPADIDGTNFSYRGADFSTSSDQTGNFMFKTPTNLSGTTASIKFGWMSNNAACNNGSDDDVCWQIDGDSFTNDAAFHGGSLGATDVAVTDRCIANGDVLISPAVTFTHSMNPDEVAVVSVTRDTDESSTECAAGDDDYAQNATLLWVEFCYEVDNVFSGE